MAERDTKASGATQELHHDGLDLALDLSRVAGRVDQAHALGLGALDLQIASPHTPVEGERLLLEVVEAPYADSSQPVLGAEIEEQGEAGEDAPRRAQIHLADDVGVQAAAGALIGEGGVSVAVAEHDASAREPGPDLLDHVLMPGGQEQEHLGERTRPHAGTLEDPADGQAEGG